MFSIGSCRVNSNKYIYNNVHNTKQILITLNFLLKNSISAIGCFYVIEQMLHLYMLLKY